MGTKVYVGNLSYKATTEQMESFFSEVGPCQASIITDRETQRSRGFGFVEFSDADAALQAIQRFNEREFMGRKLIVNEAHERERRR